MPVALFFSDNPFFSPYSTHLSATMYITMTKKPPPPSLSNPIAKNKSKYVSRKPQVKKNEKKVPKNSPSWQKKAHLKFGTRPKDGEDSEKKRKKTRKEKKEKKKKKEKKRKNRKNRKKRKKKEKKRKKKKKKKKKEKKRKKKKTQKKPNKKTPKNPTKKNKAQKTSTDNPCQHRL